MKIEDATTADVAAAAETLTAAFAHDALVAYFFRTHREGVGPASTRFFSLLLRLRIALGMPALALRDEQGVLGVAMGYDCERPVWPEPFAREWSGLEEETPGLGGRLAAYEALSRSHEPPASHYYLGVLGVHPSAQGQGAGKALLEAFCRRSAADPISAGVYLDTGNPSSLEFYLRNGFTLRGEDDLEGAPLWCVFRSDSGRPSGASRPERQGGATWS
jgi:GNAT superfamily N-acetyltransferase